MRTLLAGILLAGSTAAAARVPGIARTPAGAVAALAGHWEGRFEREGKPLSVAFDFTIEHGAVFGRFSSPEQRALEYPFDEPVKVDDARVHFAIGGGSLTLDGRIIADTLSGELKYEGAAGTFFVRRSPAPVVPYRRMDVTFENTGVHLAGSVFLPAGHAPPYGFAAVIFVHGSGPESRWGTARFYADQLARAGIAALIYDKRASGESGGDWRTASFEALADDALAGVRLLASRKDIDRTRIGIFGHSQGGMIGPLAAARGGEIAFVIAADTIAGPVFEQDLYRVDRALADEFPPPERDRAMALYRLFVEVARGKKAYEDLERESAAVRGTKWFEWLALPPRDHWIWAWYRLTGNVDTREIWPSVKVPVLLVYGERDALVPVGESIARIEKILTESGNSNFGAVIVPKAEHNLTVHPEPGQPFDWWRQPPGLTTLLVAWIALQARHGGV